MQRKYGVDIKQAAKELGVSVNTIYVRLKSGWNIEDALSVGYIPQKERIYNHKKKYDVDIKKAAEKLRLDKNTIYVRLHKGWSLEKAISTPVRQGKYKNTYKPAPVKIESCDGLQKSLSNLYGTIDKILQAKIAMRKLAKLPELAEHFTTLSKEDNETIDEAIGGIKAYILNNPKPDKEFIYNVVGTDGKNLHTNDKAEFMAFMAEVA